MAWLLLPVLALLASQGLAGVIEDNSPKRVVDASFLKKQMELLSLYYHVYEVNLNPEVKAIADSYKLEDNIQNYKNATAVKMYLKIKEYNMELPFKVPFNIHDSVQQYQAINLFNLLYSAKDYDTFYKTAVYLRERVNRGMFIYVLSVAIINHPETQGIVLPPLYDVIPSHFHNSMIMNLAQRLKVQGKSYANIYSQTYLKGDDIVIRHNETVWPFTNNVDNAIAYYTNDYHLNALYYNNHLAYPFWLSGKVAPLTRPNRGQYNWYINKQLLSHYYMERLSNDLGEIPEIDLNGFVYEGYQSGLSYHNGIPFPVRPNYYSLNQPQFLEQIERIRELEHRIREAIDLGYLLNVDGEKISLRTPEGLNVLMNAIEGNVDSPNLTYYGNLITLYKELLGNTIRCNYQYMTGHIEYKVPSALELYQTTLRDPAFYMIWKRVMNIVEMYQSQLPMYTQEELSLPGVKIGKVDVDKLVTYFESVYLNVTNELPLNEVERKLGNDHFGVLVQRAQLNHKKFNVRVHVKSKVAKKVVVRYFLAPKYDSRGYEIPLHKNWHNFFLFDQMVYELPEGDSVIERESAGNMRMIEQWDSAIDLYLKAQQALEGKGQFEIDVSQYLLGYPRRLSLPKGRVGGLPLVLFVHISEYHAPSAPYGHGVNPENTLGIGTGARRMTQQPLNFPLDRPLHRFQVERLSNLYVGDVQVYHKPSSEIVVPFNY